MWQRRNRAWALKCVFPDLIYGAKIWEYDDFRTVNDENEKTKEEFKKDFKVEKKG